MTVEKTQEVKTTLVFETDTHVFKINEAKLETLEQSENFYKKIAVKIQKGLKVKTPLTNGAHWESSWKEIYTEITGQKP